MPVDDHETPSRLPAKDRRELERIAFARPQTDADAAAAAEALRRLLSDDQAPGHREPTQAASVDETVDADEHPDDVPAATIIESTSTESTIDPRPARRRSILPVLILIGLVVGLGAGVLLAKGSPSLVAGISPTPSPSPAGTGKTVSVTNALAAVTAPQGSRDVFPDTGFATSLGLETASIHRVLTSARGNTLWVGRTSQDLCIMLTFADAEAETGVDVESTCTSFSAFGDSELTLAQGGDQFSWDGSTFTVGNSPTR